MSHPDCVNSPIIEHPNRPVIAWAAGRYFFAFNLETSTYEAFRADHHQEPIRSFDCCPSSENQPDNVNSISGCWVIGADDKQITILDDLTFSMRDRFLLGKRPSVVRCADDGLSLVLADKFGDMFKLTIPDLRRITRRVISNTQRHLVKNKKDSHAKQLYSNVLEQFSVDDEGGEETNNNSCHDTEDEDLVPFAGHLSQVTALEISGDNKFIISGDRDEKIRIGNLENPFITNGYGLGHTEFITALSCPKSIPTIFASTSGDRTVKLWNTNECTELSSINLNYVPSSIKFSEAQKSFLIICEGLDGIIEIPLMFDSDSSRWSFNKDFRIINLPSTPMSILPTTLNRSNISQYKCFSSLPSSSIESSVVPVVYWTDRSGCLHLPVAISSGSPIFSVSFWDGLNIGDSIPTAFIRWWKHNREPSALTEEERLKKRLNHENLLGNKNSSKPNFLLVS